MFRSLFCAICCVIAVSLAGCVDYDEEMWLNPDLSGRLSLVVSVREELVRGQTGLERDLSENGIRREVERIPGVKLVSFQSFRDSGKVIGKISLTFDSVEKLTRPETTVASSTPVSFLGRIAIREEGGHVIFTRMLPAMPQAHSDSWGQQLLVQGLGSLFLSGNHLNYKLHIPAELLTANTSHIDGAANTVEWQYTLAQAIREPPLMTAEWKQPRTFVKTLLWISLSLAIIALGAYFWRRIAMTRLPVA